MIKGILHQTKLYAEIFALVVTRSFERAERVTKAMESRGYQASMYQSTELKPVSRAGIIFIVFAYLILITLIGTPFSPWNVL